MCKKNERTLREVRTLRAAVLCLVVLTVIVSSACEKKEAAKSHPQRVTGACEVYDKLPKYIAKPVDVNFGNKVKLVGITINKLPEDKLSVTYYWQLLNQLDTYDAVFVHFTDKDNKILSQNDHDFCQRRPFSELRGKFLKEPYIVNIPQSSKGSEIYVKLGIFSIEPNIGRLKIDSAGGLPTDDMNTRVTVDRVGL